MTKNLPILLLSLSLLPPFSQHLLTSFPFSLSNYLSFTHFSLSPISYTCFRSPFSIHPNHSLFYSHSIHHNCTIPFPLFPSHSVLIAGHRCPTPLSSRPSITYSIYIPFPFLLAGHIGITKHLSLTLLLPILQLAHIPFPFSASTAILITLHLSHASLIHLAPLSHSISAPIPQSQPHRCASLSYTSNLFSIAHTFIPSFHLHSQFTNPA